jgi:flagellar protein FlaG
MNMMISTTDLTQRTSGGEFKKALDLGTAKPVEFVSTAGEPSDSEVDNALDVVNRAAVFEQRSLSFMVDEASGRSIIKVIDRNTEQLIRQIPSEELLKVAQDIKRLQEEMGQSLGVLIDRQV